MVRAVKNKITTVKRSSLAAIDLGTVMIAVTILGIIGAVTAVSVFILIPWMQDNSAKQALSSISSSQEAYKTAYDVYGNFDQLVQKKLMNTNTKLCTTASDDGTTYNSASISETGKVFTNDKSNRTPKQAAVGTVTCFGVINNNGTFTPAPVTTPKPTVTNPPFVIAPLPPATPIIDARWESPKVESNLTNSPFCQTNSVLEYRWKYFVTNTKKDGAWTEYTIWSATKSKYGMLAKYGHKYAFQLEIRCRDTKTNAVSESQPSNVASVVTGMAIPFTPNVTATVVSGTETRWDWSTSCPMDTTPVYSTADWRDGSTAATPLTYGNDTTSLNKVRNTSYQGFIYGVTVKAKCVTELASSPWSASKEARWERAIAQPLSPGMNVAISDNGTQEIASLSWGGNYQCGPGTAARYQWKIAREQYLWVSTITTGRSGTSNAFDGFTYDWTVKMKCVNTETNRESNWSSDSSIRHEVAVRAPNVTGWHMARQNGNAVIFSPQVTCRAVVVRYGDMTPGTWTSGNPWTSGPKRGQLGWYDDRNWERTNSTDASGFYTGSIRNAGNIPSGWVYSAKGSFFCKNEITGRTGPRVFNESGRWSTP